MKKYKRQYYKDNKETIDLKNKINRDNNPEKKKEQDRKWKENNPGYRKQYYKNHKEEQKEYSKNYYQNNKEVIKENAKQYAKGYKEKRNKDRRNKRKNDPLYVLLCSMRSMVHKVFKLIGTKKENRTIEELEYKPLQLMWRLEMNFTDKMNWKNYGTYWEIDHKIPIDHFIKKEITNQKIINALCNLQPLTYKENREKSNKLIYF